MRHPTYRLSPIRATRSDALPFVMQLSSLLSHLPHRSVEGNIDKWIQSIHHDSRCVQSSDIFVAIKGATTDGRQYAPALNVAAVIADAPVETRSGVTRIYVDNARVALAQCAAALAGYPANSMPVVGITGTNGKTTTSWILEQILSHQKIACGIIGTITHRVAGQVLKDSMHTTPEASQLQPMLKTMYEAKCSCAIMEVSSIGLALHRVDAIPFRIAIFTNLSRDHLDFHDNLDDYFEAKNRLFTELLHPDATCIINKDDPYSKHLTPSSEKTLTFGLHSHADYRFTEINQTQYGYEATLNTPTLLTTCEIPYPGLHNLSNALAAIIAAESLGCSIETICSALKQLQPAPGRLELIPLDASFQAYTDYAHTPDALRHALSSLRERCLNRLILVFGCGGDRDKGKRPQMGQIAEEGADVVIVTSDNPRSEQPSTIIADITAEMTGQIEITDRKEAILYALKIANTGDVILLAGKGHEHYQEIQKQRFPFDDRQIAQKLYSELLT